MAATCGMRRGEILTLRWKDLDFSKKIVSVEQAWKSDTEMGDPKWGRKRIVPMPTCMKKKLLELRKESLHVLPDAFIFHNPFGYRLSVRWWQEQFREGMKNAKIDATARKLTPHSFRHSLNTLLRDEGIPDEKIRAAMGWSNEKIQDIYTHFGPEHLRGQAKIIDCIFS